MHSVDVAEIQKQSREALERNFKNALSHDWIPRNKARSFPLKEFYVAMTWTRTVKGTSKEIPRLELVASMRCSISQCLAKREPTYW